MSIRRLSLLFALFISSIIFAQVKHFEVKPTDAPPQIQLYVDYPDCGVLVVYSSLRGLIFQSNMEGIQDQRYLPLESKYVIYLRPIRQMIVVKSPGFREADVWGAGTPRPKEVVGYYSIEERQQVLGKGLLVIDSEPQGATISFEDFPIKEETTPYSFELVAMKYKLTILSPGYSDSTFWVDVLPGKESKTKIVLKPKFGELIVYSKPIGSQVVVNKKPMGLTPLALTGVGAGLPEGYYQIEVIPHISTLQTQHHEIMLKAGDRQIVEVKHDPHSSSLIISAAKTPYVAYLNGHRSEELSSEGKVHLPEGKYVVKVEFDGKDKYDYLPFTTEVDLKLGDEIEIKPIFTSKKVKLRVRSSEDKTKLVITRLDTNVVVFSGLIKDDLQIYPGKYSFYASKKGFIDFYSEELISDLEDNEVSIFLISIDRLRSMTVDSSLDGPEGLSARLINRNTNEISWESTQSAEYYLLDRKAFGKWQGGVLILKSPITNWTDQKLRSQYTYRLCAITDAKRSEYAYSSPQDMVATNRESTVAKVMKQNESFSFGQSKTSEKPVEFIPYEDPPSIIGHLSPEYPKRARDSRVQGTVVLEVEVFSDGTVGEIRVRRSVQAGPEGLDQAAINAVRKVKFKPGRSNGVPINTMVIIPIEFRLN